MCVVCLTRYFNNKNEIVMILEELRALFVWFIGQTHDNRILVALIAHNVWLLCVQKSRCNSMEGKYCVGMKITEQKSFTTENSAVVVVVPFCLFVWSIFVFHYFIVSSDRLWKSLTCLLQSEILINWLSGQSYLGSRYVPSTVKFDSEPQFVEKM